MRRIGSPYVDKSTLQALLKNPSSKKTVEKKPDKNNDRGC
jgi:hypothetical protein